MPYTLSNRRVLVTGGSRGLGARICQQFAREGAHVMVNYVSNENRARQVVDKVQSFGVKAFMVQGDAGNADHNARIVKETVEKLGGLDIIVANAGWTRLSDFGDLNALSLEEWNKVFYSIVESCGLSRSIFTDRGSTQSGSSMAYAVSKAAGLHLMKCIAATQGPKLRMNAILPGQLLTEWVRMPLKGFPGASLVSNLFLQGLQFTEEQIAQEQNDSVLKHEVCLSSISICSDTRSYTL
ncbi:hypothetical protein CTAM01_07879 [Colletotrichum tamarilloi]|uniref:Short chain dehydrogenase n=1 Tax=Colletotrichum tamarilloi TaxID=1209934 RepID=A0ABQ9R7F9_9PEZI|nr:uncharacterized protein CTAM01_07879 [Colletotrichum tamarilloi]KAK1497215.1 hypothetical protein CTAM01_07879 [Colletotrichum tamarilloi]